MKAVADQKLDGVWIYLEVYKAFCPEDFQLLGHGQLGNLDLGIEVSGLKTILSVNRPTNSGRKVREASPKLSFRAGRKAGERDARDTREPMFAGADNIEA